jgi:hypothetical protein
MVNFAVTPELRIGYAYDHIISDLKVTVRLHEFILLYDIVPKKSVSFKIFLILNFTINEKFTILLFLVVSVSH